ncbi:hypothetical protein SLS55_009975 [Diplodia seriata]|uniref:Uncharacterized protein n=1 Tax=Diplodia seriata TaxID=420778 RepID=A0ABR3C4R3_9PEZI
MAPTQSPSAKKPLTSTDKRTKAARRSMRPASLSPGCTTPRMVPQHGFVLNSPCALPQSSQTVIGIDSDGDLTQMSSSSSDDDDVRSPFFPHPEGMTADNLTSNAADGDAMEEDSEVEQGDDMDFEVTQANVHWDNKLNCPARPISAPCSETVNPGLQGPRSKCICGELRGGKRVPMRHAKKWHYKGPKFTFDEKSGAYVAKSAPALSTPFHTFELNGKTVCQPISVSKQDYAMGKRGSNLSAERTVPKCAHFPVTGLTSYNVPFVKGRVSKRAPNAQCFFTRVQDQARLLCLIENESRPDGSVRRRMNIHAPPASWEDPAAISHLNRWRAQFRQRKLNVTSREARKKWSPDALNYLVERLARDPTTYRSELARDVSRRFNYYRSEHAVSCAIDNHKLRPRALELRAHWEAEHMYDKFGETEQDIPMDDSDCDTDAEDEEMSEDDADVKMEESDESEDEVHNAAHLVQPGSPDIPMTDWSI